MPETPGEATRKMNSKVKAAVDFGPLLAFFATFVGSKRLFGLEDPTPIMYATGVIIVATLIALAISFAIERKVAPMPLVSAILITVFGGTTLILNDPFWLMIKTTVFYTLATGVLLVGQAIDKPLIKYVFNGAFHLTHGAWRSLTWRWIGLFVVLATANVSVYYGLGLNTWVVFKVWGVMAIIFAFALAQTPFIAKNQIEPETTD